MDADPALADDDPEPADEDAGAAGEDFAAADDAPGTDAFCGDPTMLGVAPPAGFAAERAATC